MSTSGEMPELTAWDVCRFWYNDNFKVNEENGCWEWQKYRTPEGYGKLSFNGVLVHAHRLSYYIYYAEDPGELVVRHKCDRPACSNPFHLELGTKADNSRDMVERGRSTKGDNHWTKTRPERFLEVRAIWQEHGKKNAAKMNGKNHPTTVLGEAEVREIRERREACKGDRKLIGQMNHELAEKFGVTHSNISAVALGKSHQDIV